MDTALEELLALGRLHKATDMFPVRTEFALSDDGSKWLKQVSFDHPTLYVFTDIALQHIKSSSKTS